MDKEDDLLSLLGYRGPVVRRLKPGDEFLQDGDLWCSSIDKQTNLDIDEEELLHNVFSEFSCMSCSKVFTSVHVYELHYNAVHRNVCCTCKQVYPSSYLLEIHILENHDTLFMLQAKKQNMYQCLVESCALKFPDWEVRKEHMISDHKYPSNFKFGLQAKKNRPATKAAESATDNNKLEVNMDTAASGSLVDINSNMDTDCQQTTSRTFTCRVPKTISFGKGVGRGFRPRGGGKHWHQQQQQKGKPKKPAAESLAVGDLQDALMDVTKN